MANVETDGFIAGQPSSTLMNPVNSKNLLEYGNILGKNTYALDRLFLDSGYGPMKSAVTANYYGINHRGVGNPVPKNMDNYGLTFFTRPRLRLSYDNIAKERSMVRMLNKNPLSVHRAIRAMLDPVGSNTAMRMSNGKKISSAMAYGSPLIDPVNPFMTLLNNSMTTMSGWPDWNADTYTSPEGLLKEAWSMYDGVAKYYGVFDLNIGLKNMVDNPIGLIFEWWYLYGMNVYNGDFTPYLDQIIDNEKDYETRIYRFILDPTRTYIQKWAATGASFPTNVPIGASFNFNESKPFIEDTDDYSISFRSQGAIYNDPILFRTFNEVVYEFNPYMSDATRPTYFIKLTPAEKRLFNYFGYPRINTITQELEWWVSKPDYKNVMKKESRI